MRNLIILTSTILVLLLVACSSSKKATGKANINSISKLVFLSEYDLQYEMKYKNTTVGGLSGIDYDKAKDVYYMISDDRGTFNFSRFYTAKIVLSANKIDTIIFTEVTTLLNPLGKPYSDNRTDPTHSLDGEALRFNPLGNEIVYSAEGERSVNKDKQFLVQNPIIYSAHLDGSFKDSFELPQNLYFHETENGPRTNSVFEGLTFTNDYQHLYLNVEEPIYEDGPRAATGDSTAWIRFIKFDMKTKKQVAQYGYKIDALPYPSNPPGAAKINGVSDILYAGSNKFIVIERAYMTGRSSNYVQVFLADASKATDISSVRSVQSVNSFNPVTKKLLINMESLNRHIDNIEGVTFGPLLPNGHQSLLFVVDDNFSVIEKQQFFLFEVIP